MGTDPSPTADAPLAEPPLGPLGSGAGPDARMATRGEDAEWFRNLSPARQEEYRAHWRRAAGRAVAREETRKRSFDSGAIRGAAVFLLTHLMFGQGGLFGLGVATAIGALLGLAWIWYDAGPMKSCVSAGPVYAAVWFATNATGAPYLVFFAVLIAMPLAAAAGTSREFRQSDGQE